MLQTHRIKECKETTDVFGQPCKPKRYEKNKSALNVEQEDDLDQSCFDMDQQCLDLAVLEFDDPWESSDPWCVQEKFPVPPPPTPAFHRPIAIKRCQCCATSGAYDNMMMTIDVDDDDVQDVTMTTTTQNLDHHHTIMPIPFPQAPSHQNHHCAFLLSPFDRTCI